MATVGAHTGKNVLLIGPGFIGWNVLELLVKDQYNVTAFTRSKEHAAKLTDTGAKNVVLGSLDDKQLISDEVTKHDIVLHIASADHAASAEAVLDGVQRRADKGQSTIYIHTSGTKPEEINALPDNAPHRQIDLGILDVQKKLGAKAKIAIVMPPLIYGYNDKHGRLSIQIPTLTRFALKHGFAGYVGEGDAVWSQIHVKDLARGYRMILHQLESTPADSPELLENPYYFCECAGDQEVSWKEIAALIGHTLHEQGKIADPTPRQIDPKLYGDIFGADFTEAVMGLNSRSRAERLRALGWKPVEKSWQQSFVMDELPVILKEDNSKFAGYGAAVAS
ncbi:hypothetical protein PG989_002486 [Apiospora arundinis]